MQNKLKKSLSACYEFCTPQNLACSIYLFDYISETISGVYVNVIKLFQTLIGKEIEIDIEPTDKVKLFEFA